MDQIQKQETKLATSSEQLLTWLPEVAPKNFVDVWNSTSKSLIRISKTEGLDVARARIIYLISDLLEWFNLKRMMNTQQIDQTTTLIFECYPHYKIDDFILCFNGIKKGVYIKMYEGIDGAKILECIEMYDSNRDMDIVEIRRKESDLYKKENPLSGLPQSVINEIKKKINVSPDRPKKEVQVRKRTEVELIFDNYMGDFEKLYVSQKRRDSSMRFVEYKKKMCSIEQYCNERFNEDYKL